jgi:hypothetical protein
MLFNNRNWAIESSKKHSEFGKRLNGDTQGDGLEIRLCGRYFNFHFVSPFSLLYIIGTQCQLTLGKFCGKRIFRDVYFLAKTWRSKNVPQWWHDKMSGAPRRLPK